MQEKIEKILNGQEEGASFIGTTITPANLIKFLQEHYKFVKLREENLFGENKRIAIKMKREELILYIYIDVFHFSMTISK